MTKTQPDNPFKKCNRNLLILRDMIQWIWFISYKLINRVTTVNSKYLTSYHVTPLILFLLYNPYPEVIYQIMYTKSNQTDHRVSQSNSTLQLELACNLHFQPTYIYIHTYILYFLRNVYLSPECPFHF